LTNLRREARIATSLGCLIPIVTPILAIAAGVGLEPFISPLSEQVIGYLLVVTILAAIIACAVAMLRGAEMLTRAGKLRKTRKCGFLRAYHGPHDWYDPTDVALRNLGKARLLYSEVPGMATVELFPHVDEVFAVNGAVVKKILKVTLTTAAARPTDAVVLDIPKAWLTQETEWQLERRRPSDEERKELAQYAKLPLRYWVRTIAFGILMIPGFGYLLAYIAYFLSQNWYPGHAHAPDPLDAALRAALLAPVIAVVVTGNGIRRNVRVARLVRQDVEFGWIFMISPPAGDNAQDDRGPINMVERLPISNLIWTIGGKPAGWRRYSPTAWDQRK
jgi:hypothetical protein